jgi:hypothetical protein
MNTNENTPRAYTGCHRLGLALAWLGLAWLGLAWFGLAWLGLAWLGLGLALAISASHSLAQQKQRVSYKSSAETSKYTQQHVIDVGDMPGHQVRVFEIYRVYLTSQGLRP